MIETINKTKTKIRKHNLYVFKVNLETSAEKFTKTILASKNISLNNSYLHPFKFHDKNAVVKKTIILNRMIIMISTVYCF